MKVKELKKKERREYNKDYLIESDAMSISNAIGSLLDEKICQYAAELARNRGNLKLYSVTGEMVPRIEEQDIMNALIYLLVDSTASFYEYMKSNGAFND